MLGLSATWQGLYCTALLMVLCAGICASMMAVLWRTPARYAAGCMLSVLICFVLLYGMLDGMDRSVTAQGFWRMPLGLMISLPALLACWSGWMLACLFRWRRGHLTQTSVKEGLDQLPAGLCFHVRGGRMRLVNERMDRMCRTLTGEPLMNGEAFWHRLETGDVLPGIAVLPSCGAPLIQTPDGHVWRFERSSLCVGGEDAVQIVASDVTREQAMNLRLQEENLCLADMNRRLRRYGGQIRQLTREREALEAKVRIHDEFGRALLSARRLTSMP